MTVYTIMFIPNVHDLDDECVYAVVTSLFQAKRAIEFYCSEYDDTIVKIMEIEDGIYYVYTRTGKYRVEAYELDNI